MDASSKKEASWCKSMRLLCRQCQRRQLRAENVWRWEMHLRLSWGHMTPIYTEMGERKNGWRETLEKAGIFNKFSDQSQQDSSRPLNYSITMTHSWPAIQLTLWQMIDMSKWSQVHQQRFQKVRKKRQKKVAKVKSGWITPLNNVAAQCDWWCPSYHSRHCSFSLQMFLKREEIAHLFWTTPTSW